MMQYAIAQVDQLRILAKIDSLCKSISVIEHDTAKINPLNDLAQLFIDDGLLNKADSTAREALNLSAKTGYKKYKGDSYNKIGLVKMNSSNYIEAREYFQKALTEDRLVFNQPGYIKRLGNIGITYLIQRNFEMAMQYNQIALSMAKLYGEKNLLAFCYNLLGNLLAEKEDRLQALQYFSKAIEINKIPYDRNTQYNSLRGIGLIYESWGDYDKAHEYIFKSLKVAEIINNKYKIEITLSNIGHLYKNEGNFSLALEYYFRALKMAEELGSKDERSYLFAAIGGVYYDNGDHKHASEYYFKGFELIQNSQDQVSLAHQMGNLALIYAERKDHKKAIDYYLKSIQLCKGFGAKGTINTWLNNLAIIYSDSAKVLTNKDSSRFYYSKALQYLLEAKKNAEDLDMKNDLVHSYFLIGHFYHKQNKLIEAEENYKKALEMSMITGEVQIRRNAHEMLSELYGEQKKLKLSLDNYKIFVALRDSIYNKASTEKNLRSEINFEFEKKQTIERAQQEKENAMAIAEQKRQKTILWFVISVALVILLTTAFTYRSYLQKRKINDELQIRNQRIEVAHKIIARKNHEITDSINYALHIQQAILPDKEEISTILPQSFVLFKPKDIVSGDFYFFVMYHDKIYIAAADCTGHGVPGGFMSMLGTEKLNNAVKQSDEPGKILSLLNEGIKSSLHQSEHEFTNRDGMDIAICSIDLKTHTIEFAGANRPIWIIRKNTDSLEEIVGTKASIGGITENDKYFSTHIVQLQAGDTFYLFSDGYADQFGVNDKKITTKRFKNLLLENKHKSLKEQDKLLEEFLNSWKGDTEQTDDMLIVGIRL